MADIGPALVTGVAAIIGVGVGAGLTYWFSALNRRHQEQREDETRWYEARREAYAALLITMSRASRRLPISRVKAAKKAAKTQPDELVAAVGAVRLVGSPVVIEAADNLFDAFLKDEEAYGRAVLDTMQRVVKSPEEGVTDEEVAMLEKELDKMATTTPVHFPSARAAFEEAARRDLGQGPSGRRQR